MSSPVVLVDLEKNMLSAQQWRELVQQYAVIYTFNCTDQFGYSLADLTEFANWISSGQIIILETAEVEQKEFEYAVVVGQLIALLEPDMQLTLISKVKSSAMLLEMMQSSNIPCHLIRIETGHLALKSKYTLPTIETIRTKPDLLLIKKYCDTLAKMKGKPSSIETLKNSLSNILHIADERIEAFIGLMINLKIIKNDGEQIQFRKKLLKQWIQLDISQPDSENMAQPLVPTMSVLKAGVMLTPQDESLSSLHDAQNDLYKNFSKIDPIQVIVARKLRELKSDKPKDIYALRDLLEQIFPKADVRLLLKELIEKGYIYWNGSEILYSHEMFLN